MNATPDILKKILQTKAQEIVENCRLINLRDLSQKIAGILPPRDFIGAIQAKLADNSSAVIAEIKKASPSQGVIRQDYDPASIAKSYEQAGAACISVLTDRVYFQGSDEHLKIAKQSCQIPVLRKDFIIDPYQVYESRVIGADCILLIVSALGDAQLCELANLAHHLDMSVLVEVHNQEELERALMINCNLIGINNRNLKTFNTDLQTTLSLLKSVPSDRIIITESAIHSSDDVALMRKNGVNAFLVGEAFMRAEDPGQQLAKLFSI